MYVGLSEGKRGGRPKNKSRKDLKERTLPNLEVPDPLKNRGCSRDETVLLKNERGEEELKGGRGTSTYRRREKIKRGDNG